MNGLANLIYIFRGILFIIVFPIQTLLFSLLGLFGALLALLMPVRQWRYRVKGWLMWCPTTWWTCNNLLLHGGRHRRWKIHGADTLNPKHWYLLIANHQSWIDILVIAGYFNRKTSPIKFFMKKELLWTLPLFGFVCYLLGYPFMRRHTPGEIKKNPSLKQKDIKTTQKACEQMKFAPTTLMNFVEGTRFSAQKQARQASPYEYLLKPRSTGISIVIDSLQAQLSGVINVTLHYQPAGLTLWQFICGRYQRIDLYYELIPIKAVIPEEASTDRSFKIILQRWLNQIWQAKDALLKRLHQSAK